MGRRLHLLILLALACGQRDAAPEVVDSAPFMLPVAEVAASDAAHEPDAETIEAADVLSGAAAEQAIAAGKTVDKAPGEKPEEKAPPSGPAFLIRPDAVGPFRLGAARSEVAKLLAGRGFLQRVATPVGEPAVEVATYPGLTGLPLLRFRVYAGRLQEIHVVARDRRAVTEVGVGVGATFGEAIDAYGDPRPVREARSGRRLGFVLPDLAGVVLVPADPALVARDSVPPATRIARILVVGPEATASED